MNWPSRCRCIGSGYASRTSSPTCWPTSVSITPPASTATGACGCGPTSKPAWGTSTPSSTPKPTPASPTPSPSAPTGSTTPDVTIRGDTRTRDQLTADALTELILTTPSGGDRQVKPGTNLAVLVDYDTLTNGLHEHGVCTTSNGIDLPVAEVRRLACEANIIPIVLDSHGVVLDEGRSKRLATDEQRLALRAMYATCAINGCDIPFDQCDIHHLKPWEPPANGETNLDNLRPLCTAGPNHHAQWHRNGWTGYVDAHTGAPDHHLPRRHHRTPPPPPTTRRLTPHPSTCDGTHLDNQRTHPSRTPTCLPPPPQRTARRTHQRLRAQLRCT